MGNSFPDLTDYDLVENCYKCKTVCWKLVFTNDLQLKILGFHNVCSAEKISKIFLKENLGLETMEKTEEK